MRPNKFIRIAEEEGVSVKELLKTLYEQHGSQQAVAVALNVSQSRVSQVMKDLGLREKRVLVEQEATCQN